MKYIKADSVLPVALVEELQRFMFPQKRTAKRNEKSYMRNDFREVVILRPLF